MCKQRVYKLNLRSLSFEVRGPKDPYVDDWRENLLWRRLTSPDMALDTGKDTSVASGVDS